MGPVAAPAQCIKLARLPDLFPFFSFSGKPHQIVVSPALLVHPHQFRLHSVGFKTGTNEVLEPALLTYFLVVARTRVLLEISFKVILAS